MFIHFCCYSIQKNVWVAVLLAAIASVTELEFILVCFGLKLGMQY